MARRAVEVPLLYYHSGFLDRVIFEVEEAVGMIKPQRNDEIPGGFAYRAAAGDRTHYVGLVEDIHHRRDSAADLTLFGVLATRF